MISKSRTFSKLTPFNPDKEQEEEKKIARDLKLENFGRQSKFYKREPEKNYGHRPVHGLLENGGP